MEFRPRERILKLLKARQFQVNNCQSNTACGWEQRAEISGVFLNSGLQLAAGF